MKTDDIAFLESCMELLGYRRVEWGHFLGPSYKQWKPVHVDRLKALITKRIELAERLGRDEPIFIGLVDLWEAILEKVDSTQGYEDRLLEKQAKTKKRFKLEDFRRIAQLNQTTMVALEKAAKRLGWTREKKEGRVTWIAGTRSGKQSKAAFQFKRWEES